MVIASEAASSRRVRSLSSFASRSNLCLTACSLSSIPQNVPHLASHYNLYFLTTPKRTASREQEHHKNPKSLRREKYEKKEREHMTNIEMRVEGDKLILVIDLI